MGEADRLRWDERYRAQAPSGAPAVGPPSAFVDLASSFPSAGSALDVACGAGGAAVWLARRGLEVLALDVSGEAVALAEAAAGRSGVAARVRARRVDLDDGLPDGAPVDVALCHLFDAPHLDDALVDRLAPGGVLAVAVLSQVGGRPGRFRVGPGELLRRFGDRSDLEVVDHREADGVARLLAHRSP